MGEKKKKCLLGIHRRNCRIRFAKIFGFFFIYINSYYYFNNYACLTARVFYIVYNKTYAHGDGVYTNLYVYLLSGGGCIHDIFRPRIVYQKRKRTKPGILCKKKKNRTLYKNRLSFFLSSPSYNPVVNHPR